MLTPGWLTPLASSSLRRHYGASLAAIIGCLLLTALVCAGSVVWVATSLRDHAARIDALQVTNRAVLQDVTDAEVGLLKYRATGSGTHLAFYEGAMGWLPSDQDDLAALAEDPEMAAAVDRQEQAIRDWIRDYASPVLVDEPRDGPGEEALSRHGQRLFMDIRSANDEVDQQIRLVVADIRDRARDIMLAALAVVVILPLLAVAAVALAARRLSLTVVEPLTDIADVLEQLRAGDHDARAAVTGPEEVRQIAAGLNSLTEENLRATEVEADVLRQLQTIDRVRTDLVSTVSHELRTPLASMQGYLELLQDDLGELITQRQVSMMGAVRRNLDRLNELITNLLALSRAEETQLTVEPVDLRSIALETATDIRLTAASRDIVIRTLNSAAPVTVLGDRSQLTRSVQNLVTNAVKFSRPGGTVEVRVAQEGGDAVVEVVDEGIGIPASDLPGLGSRFYRASNAVKAEIAGTGLGLRIVQTILDRHGGTLAVESVEGEGSTFTIRLPVRLSALGAPLLASSNGDAASVHSPAGAVAGSD